VARDGLRERKKRELHRAIERQAFQLFLAQGFDATTIEQIAATVDISPRTFFRYFPTKEDALLAYAPASLDQLLATVRSQPRDVGDVDAIRDAFLVLGSTIERHRETELSRARMIVEHPGLHARALEIQAEWERAIARELAVRNGMAEPDSRVLLLTTVCVGAHRVAFDLWRDSREPDLPSAIVTAFGLLPQLFAMRPRDAAPPSRTRARVRRTPG
jgi:AcrR family transcriptional regulator